MRRPPPFLWRHLPLPEQNVWSLSGFNLFIGTRVVERRIAYYSDFELNINDWKTEHETLELYAKHLQKNLRKQE